MSLTDESTKSEKSLLSVAGLPLLPLQFEKRDFSEKRISFLKYSLEREFASILITTPEAWVPALGDANHSFPYLSGVGRLVIKDSIMLGGGVPDDD